MQRDFYWEFIDEADLLLKQFIETARTININSFDINGVNIEKAIRNFLWLKIFLHESRTIYNEQRLAGVDKNTLTKQIWNAVLAKKLPTTNEVIKDKISWTKETSCYYTALKPLEKRMLFYCKNYRQFIYLLPVLKAIKEPIMILAKFQIPADIDLGSFITMVEFDVVSEEVCIQNEYVEQHFELIFEYANTFSILLDILNPKAIFVLEGCHEDMEILATIAKKQNIPSICIQQGWPAVMHTRFREMNYDFYLTWGKAFNKLWANYNLKPKFIDVGYMYKTQNAKREALTFFLQAPVITLDEVYFKEFLAFIAYCASTFSKQTIYVKEHPEYRLSDEQKNKLIYFKNISFVNEMPLAKLFAITEISIAAFSSTLMESVVHGVIPFVFNPGSTPGYYPDIEKEGFGIYANALENAKIKMKYLLENEVVKRTLQSKLAKVKPNYFTGIGDDTVQNILHVMGSVTNKLKN